MRNRSQSRLKFWKRPLLGIVTLIVPIVLGIILNMPFIGAQEVADWQTKAGGTLSFEVASIKQDKGAFKPPDFPLDEGDAYKPTGGRFNAAFPLTVYISFAYKISPTQAQTQAMFTHLPKWVVQDRFAIQAKAVQGNPTKDQMRLMMQSLLADRFKLGVHFETQETTVLALTLVKPAKIGPKLRPHAQGAPCDTAPPPDVFPPECDVMMLTMGSGRMLRGGSRNTTLSLIAGTLPGLGRLERPVVDRTGLSGRFDFMLEWSPDAENNHPVPGEPVPDMKGPPFQEALREQLGLKLESTKAKIQILIIDKVERPSEN